MCNLQSAVSSLTNVDSQNHCDKLTHSITSEFHNLFFSQTEYMSSFAVSCIHLLAFIQFCLRNSKKLSKLLKTSKPGQIMGFSWRASARLFLFSFQAPLFHFSCAFLSSSTSQSDLHISHMAPSNLTFF